MAGRLYKFVGSTEPVGSIASGVLKFSLVHTLNDPSELVPAVNRDEVRASLHRLRQEGYSDADLVALHRQDSLLQRLAPSFLQAVVPATRQQADQQLRATFYDDIDRLEEILGSMAQLVSSSVGLCCLTERMDALPMWAHYAANGKGLVVEYVDLDAAFPGDDTGILNEPVPVRYDDRQVGITFEPRSHESLFLSKFPDWSYEREVRIILPLEDCYKIGSGSSQIYSRSIEKRHLVRLVVGWRMSLQDIHDIKRNLDNIHPGLELCQAEIIKAKVEVRRWI